MEKYKVESLSAFLGKESTVQAKAPNFPAYNPEKAKGIEFITYLNALMADGGIHESEKELFKKFAKTLKPSKWHMHESVIWSVMGLTDNESMTARKQFKKIHSTLTNKLLINFNSPEMNDYSIVMTRHGRHESCKAAPLSDKEQITVIPMYVGKVSKYPTDIPIFQ
jgi:hypothetical protein